MSNILLLGAHTDRIGLRELEFESVRLVCVERVGVEDLYIEQPLLEVLGGDERDSGRQASSDLGDVRPGSGRQLDRVTLESSLPRRFAPSPEAIAKTV